jgi:Family of unknown function (DUF6130)
MLAHAGAADESVGIAMVFAALWIGWIGWSRLRGTGFERVPRGAAYGLVGAALILAVTSTFVPRIVFGPTDPVAATGPRIASTATITIDAPTEGEIADEREMAVELTLDGGTVIEEARSTITPDEGHIHLTVDGAIVSMTYGTLQMVDVRSLDPGRHELVAEFVAADHLPFEPRVTDTVTFEVPRP